MNARLIGVAVFILFASSSAEAGGGLPGCEWEWINPLPQGDRIQALAWGNNEYLGISESGSVQVSADGQTWALVSQLEEPDKIAKIVWDGTQYIALAAGVSGASSRLYTSPDGITWSNSPIGLSFLNDFASNGARVVIVGNNSSIYYSDDFESFTRISSFSGSWIAVVWTGSQFVALRDEDDVVTSPDGENWTLHATGVSGKYSSMVQVGTRLAAAGFQGATMTSTNGVDWEPGNSGVTSQSRVFADDTQFILTGPLNPLVSTNGVDWTATTGNLGFVLALAYSGSDYAAFGSTGAPSYSTDLTAWTPTTDAFTSANLNAVAQGGESIVVVGASGTAAVSEDGRTWNEANRLLSRTAYDLEWNGSEFVAVGSGGLFARSDDGITWNTVATPGSATLYGLGMNGPTYVVVGGQGVILSSDDGDNWLERDSGSTEQLNAVASNGSTYVVVGRRGTILRSTDLETWELLESGTTQELNDVKFLNGQYVAVGRFGTVLTSDDGATWTSQTTPNSRTLSDLHWANGQYVVTGEATILVSNDGVSWIEDTTFNTIAALASVTLPDAAVAVGRYGSIQLGTCSLFEDSFGD